MLFSWFWLSLFRYNFSESIQSCYLVLPGYLVFNAFDVFFVFSLWTRSRSPCWCSSIVIGSSCLPGFTEFFVATSSQSQFKKKNRETKFLSARFELTCCHPSVGASDFLERLFFFCFHVRGTHRVPFRVPTGPDSKQHPTEWIDKKREDAKTKQKSTDKQRSKQTNKQTQRKGQLGNKEGPKNGTEADLYPS